MAILDFIKEYWAIILFVMGQIGVVWAFANNINESIKCTLRNDILDIHDRCKAEKKITHYQLQSILCSYDRYKKLKGNSFVAEIIERVQTFEITD